MSIIQNGDDVLGTLLELALSAFRLLSHQGAPRLGNFLYLFAYVDARTCQNRRVPLVHLHLDDA